LVKPCPKCGRNTGFVTLRMSTRPNYKKKVDYNGNKYLDYDDPIKRKLIQEPDRVEVILAEGGLIFVRSYLEIWKEFKELLPRIFEKYNQLFPSESWYREAVTKMIDLIPKTLTPLSSPSFTSKRYVPDKRSLYGLDYHQWSEIGIFSARHSLRETAKKYGLSVNRLRSQLEVIEDFSKEIISCAPAFLDFKLKMKMIMLTDAELRSRYRANCDIIINKSVDECESIIKRAVLAADNLVNTPQDENMHRQTHSYQYYYIIHQTEQSDDKVRIMSSARRRVTCGPFTESKLPVELLLEYQNRHQNKDKIIPNDRNRHRYKIHIDKIKSFRDYYPKQVQILRNLDLP
jgi:hypothetical protein